MPDLRGRVDAPELMDTAPVSPADLRRALAFLAFANRWCGGTRVVIRHLESWAARWPTGRMIRLLDVGCGSAEIPFSIGRWASRRGLRVAVTGIDLVESIAGIGRGRAGRAPGVSIEAGDLFEFARRPVQYDYVTASLFLHHIAHERAVDALRACDGLATRGVIVSDLHRTSAAYRVIRAVSLALGNAVVRHDAPLSVRRAFRIPELSALARQAGLGYLRASVEPWFRVSLAGEKPHAW
ncbi:MAG: methyltransferase domain-containing protein [Acidobacteria bacterium]|nr:methyltransferase domain-containing protein [Acidobacteriota bacterium]